jgi:predicted alpha/beta-fold hydrolase
LERDSALILRELAGDNPDTPIVLLAHGMGGCSESGYIRRLAFKLWQRGTTVIMMNHKGSGLSMGMSPSLWNGGSSDDMAAVVSFLEKLYPRRSLLIIGFSLSGNIVLKYLGEGRDVPHNVIGAFSINPPIDLKISSEIISSPRSWIFGQYYMNLINRQVDALEECFPSAFRPEKRQKTIWDFDVAYTAPAGGFRDVTDYYQRSSGKQFISGIRVPTIILCAKDDPFVPPEVFANLPENPSVTFHAPDHGGHMGYISKQKTSCRDHRWLDDVLLDWIGAF